MARAARRGPSPHLVTTSESQEPKLHGVRDRHRDRRLVADRHGLEDDADDLNDPDNVPNLQIKGGGADCDAENGSHNPGGNGCAPVSAYSMPMNARLMIFFGQPPLGVWITSVTASETMSYSGPVYWNLLFDLNQDGSWDGDGEWQAGTGRREMLGLRQM